jgi:hypothetical protein
MLALRRIELGKAARAYMREQLDVPTVFCRTLLSVIDTQPGRFFTLVPERSTVTVEHEFRHGGLLEMDRSEAVHMDDGSVLLRTPNIRQQQAERLLVMMQGEPTAFCIVDDYLGEPPLPCDSDSPHALQVGDECHYVLGPSDSADALEGALYANDNIWHGATALCVPPRLVTRSELIDPAVLAECARWAREIEVTAYDAEGFVAWERA